MRRRYGFERGTSGGSSCWPECTCRRRLHLGSGAWRSPRGCRRAQPWSGWRRGCRRRGVRRGQPVHPEPLVCSPHRSARRVGGAVCSLPRSRTRPKRWFESWDRGQRRLLKLVRTASWGAHLDRRAVVALRSARTGSQAQPGQQDLLRPGAELIGGGSRTKATVIRRRSAGVRPPQTSSSISVVIAHRKHCRATVQ